jgi:hypothetical protein
LPTRQPLPRSAVGNADRWRNWGRAVPDICPLFGSARFSDPKNASTSSLNNRRIVTINHQSVVSGALHAAGAEAITLQGG